LVECLREGARRFGWREPPRRDGRWLVGSGRRGSRPTPHGGVRRQASAHADADGGYLVRLDAIDIGTGAWTVLTQIAADALDAPLERVRVEIGDSALPAAGGAGGSMGTASWGSAIVGGRPGRCAL
jgi:xanthine dehydrogenase YagR molybdenum-binding subunit